MRARHKKWAAPFLNDHPEFYLEKVESENEFFKSSPLYLEIGSGKGDFIIQMAAKHPGNYLALEREISVLGVLGKKLAESGLSNVKVRGGDFDKVFEELKEIKFDKIFLNFSDPWPKKKHWKRRLTTKERLSQMASLLKDDGLFLIKTDNESLCEFTLEQAPLASLKIVGFTDDYLFDEETDAMSEYERNFRSEGKKIHRITLSK